MTVHVFLGPTLSAERARAIVPDVVVHPPIRHLDVLRLDLEAGDTVAVVDGLFFQTAAVRHKELLWLLDQGVRVAGSSSMGALRAAELAPFGMRGVGTVYDAFASGRVDGDDEVAVAHGDAESGWRSFTDPLINIRCAATRAGEAGILTELEAHAVVCHAREMPFTQRKLTRAIQRCHTAGGLGADTAADFQDWAQAHSWDAKAEDAVLLLSEAAAGGWATRPKDSADLTVDGYPPLVRDWLERTRPIRTGHGTTTDWQVESVLRLFGPEPLPRGDHTPTPPPRPRFEGHPAADIAVAAAAYNDELARRGERYRPSHIADATVDRFFGDLWAAQDDLVAEVRRRGFTDLHDFRSRARLFLAYAVAHGAPVPL
ncbi:hypothetical protein SD37_16755 [Amycolatopsis orientalis]|uniref:TfuA-like core domain-containing protein n=1 Tax=Amycolatopsis orientalis TaxID=31958 RepID=A0A193BY84_AMYOR|nr:TfuA-like protein [Amycolatopsis orientalis]ANN17129.1 hypothetical protein SD37_16755 [Amycolatopsis orientalis]